MTDTEEEFRKKDREYFDLIGRTVMLGEWPAKIIEYRAASGPRYLFRLQFEGGPYRGEETETQRGAFYVLPEITDSLVEEACEVLHDAYERAAVVHGWETNPAARHKPWSEVPESNKATMRDAVRALLEWRETL